MAVQLRYSWLRGRPAAAPGHVGGIGTPVGNALNMLCMSMVEQAMGVTVTFGQWCVTMIPIAIVTPVIASFVVVHLFKCEEIKPEALDVVKDKLADYGKMSAREIKIIVWFVIVFGICLASTWIPAIQSMLVCFIGAVIAFIPGISLLTKEDWDAAVSWDIIMLIIGVQCLVTGMRQRRGPPMATMSIPLLRSTPMCLLRGGVF